MNAMKSSLPLLAIALVFGSCTTAYKSGQTPDDVYYSPTRPQDEYVRTERRDDRRRVYEEELRDDVEAQEAVVGPFERLVGEADDDKDDGQDAEAAELDGFAADEIHRGDGHPVSGDGTGADQNEIADGVAVEVFVDVAAAGPADGAEDDGVVQTEAVER